jgi:hypothetical protein
MTSFDRKKGITGITPHPSNTRNLVHHLTGIVQEARRAQVLIREIGLLLIDASTRCVVPLFITMSRCIGPLLTALPFARESEMRTERETQ